MLSQGMGNLEHLVDVCIQELQINARLHLVDTADIHKLLRLEVLIAKSPLHQHLGQIFAGCPATILDGLLGRGFSVQSQARPTSVVVARPQRLETQQNTAEVKDPLERQTLSPDKHPLKQQASAAPAETYDHAAHHQLEELKLAAAKPSAPVGKPPVLVVTPRAPAKPLLPGGPCENPFCGVVEAPQWRRIDKKLVCNRCGMYWHRHAQFPDASYFNGLASKQAVRHIVVMHRSRQGASPSGSTPPAPPAQQQEQEQQEQDKAPGGSRPSNQLAAQAPAQHKAPARDPVVATTARSPGTDSRGSATTNNAAQGAGIGFVGGLSSSSSNNNSDSNKNDKESSGENKNNTKNISNNDMAGGGAWMTGPPLDQDVILKVLTKQWGQLDASTVWRVQVMLEQLQHELHQQQLLQLLQQQRLIQLQGDALDARSGPQPPLGPAAAGGPSTEAAVPTQVLAREGDPAGMCGDFADAAGGRWPTQSQSEQLPSQQQRQQHNGGVSGAAATMAGAGVTDVGRCAPLQSPARKRQGPGSAQPRTSVSARGGPAVNPLAQLVLKQQTRGCSSNAPQPEASGGAALTQGHSCPGQDVASDPAPAAVPSSHNGEGSQGRLPGSVLAGTDAEDCPEQRPPKRARAAVQTRMSPPRSAGATPSLCKQRLQLPLPPRDQQQQQQQPPSQELLLPPMLAVMLQHNKAVLAVQEQQQQQQQRAPAAHHQQQQKQKQQHSEASFDAANGARPGRSLLETIARVAQQQRTTTPNHHHHHQQPLEHYPKRQRDSEDEEADGRGEAMEWSYGTIGAYDAASVADSGLRADGGGGILMRDLQHRALLVQQHRANGSRHGRGGPVDGPGQRGAAPVRAPRQESSSATGAGVSRSAVHNIAGDPYDVGRSHVQALPYKAAASVGASGRGAPPPSPLAPHGGAATAGPPGLDAAELGHSRGTTSYVDNILDMLLSRGGSVKAKVVQQLQQQLQAQVLPIDGLPHTYAPGVLGGVRQSSGAGSGLIVMPVLDLGKPPPALAF
ncbi:hypothetical protein Vretimale_17219 [Volvox reticuliferus]|uniref:GATA-type domain-containing protein n=1 Tax=Volvox reticuliferus TaxID=1737510 RepID=A0A8J4CU82_9CHLO|nr:hypothetical protein Vretifemale_16656 [Volvox reticuliferus]GIM14330.1 hypothetical protein Vretimale_17219 [Volvox reticuliferus]